MKPTRELEYFYGVGDLIEFDISEYRVTDRPAEVDVRGRDPKERKNLKATGSDSKTARPTLGNQNSLVLNRDITGKLHSLSDFRGKKVFLSTWASW